MIKPQNMMDFDYDANIDADAYRKYDDSAIEALFQVFLQLSLFYNLGEQTFEANFSLAPKVVLQEAQ